MFIEAAGGTNYITPTANRLTLAMTTSTGTVTINQRDATTGWFPVVCDGEAITLSADNTIKSLYAPCKLQVVAVGTGVRLYNHAKRSVDRG